MTHDPNDPATSSTPDSAAAESPAGALGEIAAGFAAHGLGFAKLALETSARTLHRAAALVGALRGAVDRRASERG